MEKLNEGGNYLPMILILGKSILSTFAKFDERCRRIHNEFIIEVRAYNSVQKKLFLNTSLDTH